jgi:hypothetical protein
VKLLAVTAAAATAGTSLSEVATTLGAALLALAGVWVGSTLARGREDRAWRRGQLVDASSGFIRATSAVEQWAMSEQFAARLGAGQYPTDYKEDLEELEAAVAVLSISTSETLSKLAAEASGELRDYVLANAAHQAARPRGNAMDPASYQRARSEWRVGDKAVEIARDNWKELRAAFVKAARADLDALK